MPSNRMVRDVIAAEAIALYETGLSLAKVAKRLLVSPATIGVILREAKVPTRPRRTVPAEAAERVLELYADGLTASAIAEQVGFSAWTIGKVLEREGVERDRRRPGPRLRPIVHGTLYAYEVRGCRCDPCVEVKLDQLQLRREQRQANKQQR